MKISIRNMSSWANKVTHNFQKIGQIVSYTEHNIIDIPDYTIKNTDISLHDIVPIFYNQGGNLVRIETISLDKIHAPSYSLICNSKHIRVTSNNISIILTGNIEKYTPIMPSKIPKVIIQTWDTAIDETSDLSYPMRVLKTMNPEYKYIFFNAEERREFIRENFSENVLSAFDKIKPIALKCDLWRYCYLYINGGIYIDIKSFTARPLFSILDKDYELLIISEQEGKGLFNGIMGAPPKHQFIKMLIDESVKNINNNYYGESPLDITGPDMCRRIYNIYREKDINNLIIPDNNNYKYFEFNLNDVIKDIDKNNIAFHRVFSTYYSNFNKLNNPNRFWNAWIAHDIYN